MIAFKIQVMLLVCNRCIGKFNPDALSLEEMRDFQACWHPGVKLLFDINLFIIIFF